MHLGQKLTLDRGRKAGRKQSDVVSRRDRSVAGDGCLTLYQTARVLQVTDLPEEICSQRKD